MRSMKTGFDLRFISTLKRQKRILLLGLMCVFFVAMLDLAPAAFIKWAIDAISIKVNGLYQPNTYQVGMMCIFVIAIYSTKYWFTRGQTYYLSDVAQRVTAYLRKDLFKKLQSLPIAYFNAKRVGAIQSVITNDVATIQSGVPLIRDFISAPIKAVGGLSLLFFLNWKLALIALVGVPPVVYVITRNS